MSEPPAHFTAVPRKPRLIVAGQARRPKTADPVPAQTVEILRSFCANPNQATLDLGVRRLPIQGDKWSRQGPVMGLP